MARFVRKSNKRQTTAASPETAAEAAPDVAAEPEAPVAEAMEEEFVVSSVEDDAVEEAAFVEAEEARPTGDVAPEGVEEVAEEVAEEVVEEAAEDALEELAEEIAEEAVEELAEAIAEEAAEEIAEEVVGELAEEATEEATGEAGAGGTAGPRRRRRRPGTKPGAGDGAEGGESAESAAAAAERAEKDRSQMLVHVDDDKIQIAILEGRTLVEHYTAHRRAQSIAGNIYLGKVQNVLPGMEAAFVDIGTPKNAVLYAGDVRYVAEEYPGTTPRIEDILTVGQSVLVQVVKDPMGAKGARLTTEISLPGRFVVLVPETDSTGISRRLPESERDRLRSILDRIRPDGFGIIVRTAAEETTERQLQVDFDRLEALWHDVYRTSTRVNPPTLIYEEPEIVIRTVRENFSADFRRLIVDDAEVHARISEYLGEYEPELLTKVVLYEDEMPLFRRHHVTDQLKTGLARKVWLPSGGSLVFDKGEALTVIDVNTSKNVGKSSLEETVYQNNLEAAEEIARQLRLRDIGGIIVIDFIDMEIKKNRDAVLKAFRQAVNKDKTKTQVYDISELGLVEMTRKNVSEGLIESFSRQCTECSGRGILIDEELLG